MSKEAMKLAKAWFERNTYGDEAVDVYDALCEALAEQPAQQALDKMAENARELELDYEPAQQKESMRPYRLLQDNGSKYFGDSWDKAEQPAQQEPVAWMYPDDYERMTTSETFCTVYSVEVGSATRGETTVALYTSPTAQPDKKQQALDKMADNAKELGLDYEPATYTFKQSSELMIATFDMKPNHNMTFHNQDGKHVGTLDFNGPEMVFTGDADESVKVFFDFIANAFKARLEQERADEREACAKVCEERIEFWQRDDGRRYEDEYCAAAIREMGNT